MERLKVLRSSAVYENILSHIPTDRPTMQSITEESVASSVESSSDLAETAEVDSAETITTATEQNVSEENISSTDKLATLNESLIENGHDPLHLEETVENREENTLGYIPKVYIAKALTDEEIAALPPEPEVILDAPMASQIITNKRITNTCDIDNVLTSNYNDELRGNVIKTHLIDSLYSYTLGPEDLYKIYKDEFTPIGEHRCVINVTDDAMRNIINNPFAGLDISNGCTISAWIRYSSMSQETSRQGLMLFVDNYKMRTHPHPNYIYKELKSNAFLYLQTNLEIWFDAIFNNAYYHIDSDGISRFTHNWHHIIYSITNNGIVVYLDGVKRKSVDCRGKRFNGGNGGEYNNIDFSITDFLSQEDTKLYLGTTLCYMQSHTTYNLTEVSDPVYFDDITFYSAAATDEEAKALYEEALTINLP